jgi:acyl carrier protein
MSEGIETRLQQVFRTTFDDPGLLIARTTTANDVEGWDSLTHIDLMVAVEKEFTVRFTTSEVTKMKNVGDLIDAIERRLS